jgi:acylphosphatase
VSPIEDNSQQPAEAAVRWLVAGRVQGVGFRFFVLGEARRLRIRGDVYNLPDGRVEVRASGTPGQLAQLRSAVQVGPGSARVDGLAETDIDPGLSFEGFRVRY